MNMGARQRGRTRFGRLAALAALCAAAVLVNAAAAQAESCVYDDAAKTVTATITPGGQATLVVSGGALWFGAVPAPCGAATTGNTDSISISGSVGTNEVLTLDQRGGVFGPGATAEFNVSEIEIATALGDGTDRIIVYGTEGPDSMSPGQLGMSLNTDGDVDVTFSPGIFPLEIHGLGGNDYINGRGQGGAGLHFLGPLVVTGGEGDDQLLRGSSEPDVIDGGPGNDTLDGQEGADTMTGGAGNDTISAGGGNDTMTGGPGLDSFSASSGDDTIYAEDDEADTSINGGAGVDTAYYDEQVDLTIIAVENRIGDGGPPPPPGGACTYNAATKAVSATIPAGTQATLVVVGTEIHFGATPTACQGATTTNTDSIAVAGSAGTVETLTLDLSGGAFAPGAAAESNTPEIEITTNLGDAADGLVVRGTTGPDTISIGTNGLALNTDGDRDVTVTAPAPAVVEMIGLGGPNTLSARGGYGAGSNFAGTVILRAGDSGDTLRGGLGNDELYGGAGNDTIEGYTGNDTADGAGGNDSLTGNDGDDTLTGGAGADSLTGAGGNDVMHAEDDAADTSISGGPGADTAYYDQGIDPTPVATETLIPA
jgi:Ca2+-binding RTX toxin-like protein